MLSMSIQQIGLDGLHSGLHSVKNMDFCTYIKRTVQTSTAVGRKAASYISKRLSIPIFTSLVHIKYLHAADDKTQKAVHIYFR